VRYLLTSRTLISHIPRCGGTFVEQSLESLGISCSRWTMKQDRSRFPRKHPTYPQLTKKAKAQVDRIAVFVRDPVALYPSIYRYLASVSITKRRALLDFPYHPHAICVRFFSSSFEEFVRSLLHAEPSYLTRQYENYIGPEGGEFVDFVGRTERIREDLSVLLARTGEVADFSETLKRLEKLPRANEVAVPRVRVSPSLQSLIRYEERKIYERFYGENYSRVFFGSFLGSGE